MESKKVKTKQITPVRLKKALEGSCGLKSTIVKRLECTYNALYKVLQKEGDAWDECRYLYKMEQERVGDIAENTILETMQQTVELAVASQTARWYLDRKHVDRGYGRKEQVTVEGGSTPIMVNHTIIPIDALKLPVEIKREILKAMELWERENRDNESSAL